MQFLLEIDFSKVLRYVLSKIFRKGCREHKIYFVHLIFVSLQGTFLRDEEMKKWTENSLRQENV